MAGPGGNLQPSPAQIVSLAWSKKPFRVAKGVVAEPTPPAISPDFDSRAREAVLAAIKRAKRWVDQLMAGTSLPAGGNFRACFGRYPLQGSRRRLIAEANNTIYGLAAGVWTKDSSKAQQIANRLKAGTVWINCYHVFDSALPFGGYKQSGWGREMGEVLLSNYLETKAITSRIA